MPDRLHVLLVESNPSDADLIRELLATDGQARFEIECVPQLSDALGCVRQDSFDIILLDLELPDSNGLKSLQAMRQGASCVPIVVLTGNDDEKMGLAAIQEGAQDYIIKGQTLGSLLARVLCYAMGRHLTMERLLKQESQLWAQKMEEGGQLIGGIAHDLNNSLSILNGHSQMLLKGIDPSDSMYPSALEIRKAGQRFADIPRQLLAFAHRQIAATNELDKPENNPSPENTEITKGSKTIPLLEEHFTGEGLSAKLRGVLSNTQKKKITSPLLSILAVDDEEEILQILDLSLTDSGYAVDTAISASEALKKIKSKHFDLVISDMNMPDMSGLELLRSVRTKEKKTDFILISGLPDFKAAVTAIKEGAYDYLPKPFNLDDLQEKIDRFILDRKNRSARKTRGDDLGKIRNGYSVIKSLGSGGAGTVLLVEKNNSYFAMKILNNTGTEIDNLTKKRFEKEAKILKSLDNEYVVKLFDVGGFEGDDMPYLVMEYVHGAPLSKYIRNIGLKDDEKLSIILQIASALDYIHSKNILHCDLKPDNVLLTENLRVKISDFGIAKILDPSRTLTDTLRGSPCYMAPEILKGETVGDSKSDIFSFGVLAYELFTGERPFLGKTTHAVIENIKMSKPIAPRNLNPEIPEWLQDMMARMLDKTPENRFATVSDLIKVIKHYMTTHEDFKSGHSLTRKIFRSILFRENVWK